MPLILVRKSIMDLKADAIVNSTNHYLIGFSGVDRLIHEVGGDELAEECHAIALKGSLVPGEAVSTNAYHMNAKYIIHTIGPNWEGGIYGERAILRSVYRSSLIKAAELGCKSVAFPLISSGFRDYPIQEAFRSAVESITEYLTLYDDDEDSMKVYLVIYGDAAERIQNSEFGDLSNELQRRLKKATPVKGGLAYKLAHPGKDLASMIYDFMDQKEIKKASQIYLKTGMTKNTWHKIITGKIKNPSLKSVLEIALGLELDLEETEKLLAAAGLAFSANSRFDIIVSYFIENGNYNIWDIDVQLVKYGYDPFIGEE